jgi:hypothetical protein
MPMRFWLPIFAALALFAANGPGVRATGLDDVSEPLTLAQSPPKKNQEQVPDYVEPLPPAICYEKVNEGACDCMSFKVSRDGELEAKECVADTYCTSRVAPC